MGLLDGGIAAAFSAAFSGFYLDASLYRPSATTDDGAGGGRDADAYAAPEAVKAQLEAATEAMRQVEGYSALDVRILVLAHGVARPTTHCQIIVQGQRYAIMPPVGRDPAGAYWDLCARPIGNA